MRILLINLDRSPDRLAWMQKEMDERGLTFDRISAVDFQSLSQDEISRHQIDREIIMTISPGDVACFLSHRKCWNDMIEKGDDYVCILEDDIYLSRDAARYLSSPDWIPDGVDIVKLETFRDKVGYIAKDPIEVGDRILAPLLGRHIGAGGYIISRECAERLLKTTEDFHDPVDEMMFNPKLGLFQTLEILQMVPAICIQTMHYYAEASDPLPGSTIHSVRLEMLKPRQGWKKFKREVTRPFINFGEWLRMTYVRLTTPSVWGEIPFRE
ncbi:MAG: glycosyl transferase [Rhizobiaceae bacterium MnEN-MB40S]|nr:MAG: glycosyl transferase [Rhizobiaceae bacterium MnEN-MB40S]